MHFIAVQSNFLLEGFQTVEIKLLFTIIIYVLELL